MFDAASKFHGSQLHCQRDDRLLFEQVEFEIHAGQALLIEGANGAGKTSLLRFLCGLNQVAEGELTWCGKSVSPSDRDYASKILYIGHKSGMKADLSCVENLSMLVRLDGEVADREIIEQALDQVGLYGFEDRPAGRLSAGQHRRVALARLLLQKKPLWVLDEPLTALDVQGIAWLESTIANHLAKNGMIVMTSHSVVGVNDNNLVRLPLKTGATAGIASKTEASQ
ncbi:cytochrome c biogenesis heme-transporting ATPase CcmA [Pelagibaculum spongiae]|uniref:Heme ABC transporter ATP-binding protein CcmA n=1 Tax=Pelagibaculum spongiae TaxID=2080658 RepID=A0A2V1GY45_9GAMM|nr:cytochrome c biogenesis heme-transporting ATPase CcmA [Pelagibaculum spongiae]PVZ66683.1 heme ABC transporter ATP-binding protein CcmA [Pelagibaculum spongiae]